MGIILTDEPKIDKIALETSKRREIDNCRVYEISPFEKNQFANYSVSNYPTAIFRCNPSPLYNCHGMTFASRRTNITRPVDIVNILEDDEYEKIDIKHTMPGDVIIYRVSEGGEIDHSGIIIECDHPKGNISSIRVLSKWGKFKEVIHFNNESPYNSCIKEFYRLINKAYA